MGGIPTPEAAGAIADGLARRPVAFVCVNVGPRYGMEYVSILRDMVLRNCSRTERNVAWFCITDRPDELPEGVYPIAADPTLPGYWQKVRLFAPDMPWEPGQRVVYFDLDVCITGRLEDLIERKGIAHDFGWPCHNSSVMVWDHGEHSEVWRRFGHDLIDRSPGPLIDASLLPVGTPNGGDQEWISEVGGWTEFPREWVASYRWQSKRWPPNGAKVVQFHGAEKPHHVADGWVPNVWKVGGFTSFPEFTGANTTQDHRLDNVRASAARDLPWFTGFRDEGKTCVIVGGAPSMRDCIADIRWHARQKKTRVVSVNNAWRVLVENGVTPDVHVILDARAENAAFVEGAPKSMRFLLASQCHPDVFDAVQAGGYETAVWHCAFGENDALWEILKPYGESKPIILVPGGSTVGLRAMWLAVFSGFRKLHMYGLDSSYDKDGAHHAYAQPLNDGETVLAVARGEKTYQCAPWMVRQAAEFEEQLREFARYVDFEGKPSPISVTVHGTGLIPDIARSLRDEQRGKAA
jgi:hypothetical protein